MSSRDIIWLKILAERNKQDTQWGGVSHDDEHEQLEWMDFIEYQIDKFYQLYEDSESKQTIRRAFQERLVKIAALAIAALESEGRKNDMV